MWGERPPPHLGALWRTRDGQAALAAWYERGLASLGIPYESLSVETRFGATHALAVGDADGTPVVLLHGTNANALTWKPQLRALAGRFRIYALDIPGAPGRSAAVRLPERGPASGGWLLDVFEALAISSAHLVGISGGTALIPKFALVASRRIRSAVLMSAAGFVSLRFPFNLSRIGAFLATIDRLNGLTVRSPGDARRVLAKVSAPGVVHDDETAELFAIVMRSFRSQPPPDALPELEQRALTAPTLLLMGAHEVFFDPRKVIDQARRVLPDLRAAEIVPGAGHALASDRPELVSERLASFCADVG